MGCVPLETYCTGEKVIPCGCPCDRCEDHDLECQGCLNCVDHDTQHVWTKGIDPRWWICMGTECGMVRVGDAA